MHQSRDPAVGAVGGSRDHHPGVAVADQRRVGDVSAIEEPQHVVGVGVEVGGRDRRGVVVGSQTGQGQGVNGVTGTLQKRDHRLEAPGAVPRAGHEDERRHGFPPFSDCGSKARRCHRIRVWLATDKMPTDARSPPTSRAA